jgi:hypothetical protein
MRLLSVTIEALIASSPTALHEAGGAAFAYLPSVASGTLARVEALAKERDAFALERDALARERDESRVILSALAAAAADARGSLDAARADVAARATETAGVRAELSRATAELEGARASLAAARADAFELSAELARETARSQAATGGPGENATPPGGAPASAAQTSAAAAAPAPPRSSPPRKSLLVAETAAASSAATASAAVRDAADARTEAAYWRARAARAEAFADQLSGVIVAQADALSDAACAGEQRLRDSDADWVRCGGSDIVPSTADAVELVEDIGVFGDALATRHGADADFVVGESTADGYSFAQRASLLAHAFGGRARRGPRASRLSIVSPFTATRVLPPPPAPRLVQPPREEGDDGALRAEGGGDDGAQTDFELTGDNAEEGLSEGESDGDEDERVL